MECSITQFLPKSYHRQFAQTHIFSKSSLLSLSFPCNFTCSVPFHSIRTQRYSFMASAIPETPPSSVSDSTETPLYNLLYSSPQTLSATVTSQPPTVTSPDTEWDVFLSFRGEDTRLNFTSHLYSALRRNGIRTYIDDELRTGDKISEALIEAIQKSKIYVVVFSERYAESTWCLDELVEITNCMDTMERLVIGVYYKIAPSVVRWVTESFKIDIEGHKIRVDKMEKEAAEMKKMAAAERDKVGAEMEAKASAQLEKVATERKRMENWLKALPKVPAISGKPISTQRSEADIVEEIVEVVLEKIKPKKYSLAKYPVGLVSRVNDIKKLMSSVTKNVITIVIYGMAGMGKTTLAKELHDQLLAERSFEASCFLENVSEVWKTKGPKSVQEQLINDVLKGKNNIKVDNDAKGTEIIKDSICSKNILVIIDDIDNPEQYNSLVPATYASGSVVIITTESKNILRTNQVEVTYMLEKLEPDESRELFTRHAFGSNKPNDTFMELSEQILHLTDGHPLALKFFGSQLFDEPEKRWKYVIRKLKRTPDSTIQQKLLVSFNALDSNNRMLKSLFLDIACFFIGRKKEEAVKIMNTYYSNDVDTMIDILVEKHLLTVNDREGLRMHNLFKEMGREVARNNYHDEPGKHTRLWVSKDICQVLKNNKGTEEIEGIIPSNFYYQDALEGVSFATGQFKRMSRLRFLYLKNVKLIGSYKQAFENLRWLRWDRCFWEFLPSDFCAENLVTLLLPHSKMKTMWQLNKGQDLPVFESLTTLDMSYSLDLTTTSGFTKFPCLEILNLEDCKRLKEVHESVGSLENLVSLNLSGCNNLISLPGSICDLRALQILDIGFCSGLKELPVLIGRLSKIVKLKLTLNKELETLPETICDLRALEVLDIEYCINLKALPIKLGNLKSLKELNAVGVPISELPHSIGGLSKVLRLRLGYNKKLRTLPDTIRDLRALEVLHIDYCSSLASLPKDLGNIESLKELKAAWTPLKTLPDTICNLKSLETLDISGCNKLEKLPDRLWDLARLWQLNAKGAIMLGNLPEIESSQTALSLRYLNLSGSKITALPSNIIQLSNLEHLVLRDCLHLQSIPRLPPSLKLLVASGCTSLNQLPDLSNLKQLKALDLKYCSGLTEIQGLNDLFLEGLCLDGCHPSIVYHRTSISSIQVFSKDGEV